MEEILFHDRGDRVALLTALRIVDMNAQLVVVNTHLTFPHNDYDRMIRQEQISNLTVRYHQQREPRPRATKAVSGELSRSSRGSVAEFYGTSDLGTVNRSSSTASSTATVWNTCRS